MNATFKNSNSDLKSFGYETVSVFPSTKKGKLAELEASTLAARAEIGKRAIPTKV